MTSDLRYLAGFGNHFATESLPGALPQGCNSPQKVPYGLVAELLTGSAFTAPRHQNSKSWLYRIRPSVVQKDYVKVDMPPLLQSSPVNDDYLVPDQMRWDPPTKPSGAVDFIRSFQTVAANGDVAMRSGSAIHLYAATESMKDSYAVNADGELLIVPQSGPLLIKTELGYLEVEPLEICVIPRGVKFQVCFDEDFVRGYVLENYGHPLTLPELGPIGSNGLANPRDFVYPVARYSEAEGDFSLLTKFGGSLFSSELSHCPFDVVAWHGNFSPYKYDLRLYNTINTVSYDHPDPSIFTVLTSPTDRAGCANIDFVIFPPRWMVAENTFRPPYYHRNVMSEYMGLIHGIYDAKPAGGFEPGGGSLHSCMSPHGPEASVFDQATDAELKPSYQGDTMAFMFESSFVFKPTKFAFESELRQKNYTECWQGFKPRFDPKAR
ncbi:MAG: homogentisate 1,2-dioxygenase [Pseudobacteriovorax sp.]|nr:homogentisate 1,2-dioxygenase [Pseudobacteriovorax sp.]